jgi:hypothetical protein
MRKVVGQKIVFVLRVHFCNFGKLLEVVVTDLPEN